MEMANITYQDEEGRVKVKIDREKCVSCGRCVSACKHAARIFKDDTERFFVDLKMGVPIIVMVAPAVRTNIPQHKKLFTYLKKKGVKRIYDVSFGADLCIWGYVRYIEKLRKRKAKKPVITQPCPAIVNYCKIHKPGLLKYLAPVHSPMGSLSVFMKKYEGITDKIAAICPCIAKHDEFEQAHVADYNITFARLLEYLAENSVVLPEQETEFEASHSGRLGSLFPMPGGLKENLEFYFDREIFVSRAEGRGVFRKLDEYLNTDPEILPDVYDVLSCDEG